MCYVHPIHPTLCGHHYYLLLSICGPNASLRTCPSSKLIVTGPPGWNGLPKCIEGGLCPRCDLVNEGVDLSRIRFYKPEKVTSRKKSERGKNGVHSDGPRWSIEGNGLTVHAQAKGNNCSATMGQAAFSSTQMIYPFSHSVQSLPSPRTAASSRIYEDDSDVEYSSENGESGPGKQHSHRARRWLTAHIHRPAYSTIGNTQTQHVQTHMAGAIGAIEGIKDTPGLGRGRRRDRLKTVLKKSLSPLKDMVEGIEHKFVHASPKYRYSVVGLGMTTTGAP